MQNKSGPSVVTLGRNDRYVFNFPKDNFDQNKNSVWYSVNIPAHKIRNLDDFILDGVLAFLEVHFDLRVIRPEITCSDHDNETLNIKIKYIESITFYFEKREDPIKATSD